MNELSPFSDKVVVVLGASSGLGHGTAHDLARLGAKVVMAARRHDVLVHQETGIREHGGIASAERCDITNPDDVRRLAEVAVAEFGQIDIWINAVGIDALGFFWDIPPDDQARVIDVNLKGLMYGAHAALTQFRRQGHGLLVNIGSIDAGVPVAMQSTYAATKAAILSLGRSLNEELRLAGHEGQISVCTIMPGTVDTPLWTNAANFTGHRPRMAAMDDPAEVVSAIVAACAQPAPEVPVGSRGREMRTTQEVFPRLHERLSANLALQQNLQSGLTDEVGNPRGRWRIAQTGAARRRLAADDALGKE